MNHGIFMGLMLALFMLFGMAGNARATDLLYTGNGYNDPNSGVTIAMEFIPEQDIRVTDLGVFDGGVDGAGLQVAHDVGLWNSSGILLATASVDNSATLLTGYRFTPITPVVLSKGQSYILGAFYLATMTGDKLVANTLTPAAFVSMYSSSRLIGGSALTFPDLGAGAIVNNDFRIAANLRYEPVDLSPININGTVTNIVTGTDICSMVLASGRYMFSCNPVGTYSLSNLFRRPDGTVKLQVFADGYMPWKATLTGGGTHPVEMTPVGSCPNYNSPYSPGTYPNRAGQWINISGTIKVGGTGTNSGAPVCSMILASGQYMFTCSGNGSYDMDVPMNSNGQIKVQVYADGYAPQIFFIDEFQPVNNILLTEAVECS